MFWSCLPTVVCTAISNGEFYKRRRCGSEQRGTATLRTKVVYGHVMTNSGKRILIQITFDVMNVRKPLLSTSALKRRGVTILFNHGYGRIIFSKRDTEFGISRLSFLLAHHFDEWNSSLQSVGDGWRECDK